MTTADVLAGQCGSGVSACVVRSRACLVRASTHRAHAAGPALPRVPLAACLLSNLTSPTPVWRQPRLRQVLLPGALAMLAARGFVRGGAR